MKKIIGFAVIGIAFGFSQQASAGPAYGKAGCGLGSRVMAKDSQVLAATTNGTSGNQTFGISSGTSGCTDAKGTASLYIQNNQLALSNDIAKGSGESLIGLAKAYGCSDTKVLGATLQQNYSEIFKSSSTRASEMENSIRSVIGTNPSLLASCQIG